MSDLISNDFTEDNSKLPTGLNVLTILTIIGSIIGIISGGYNYMTADKNYQKTKEMLEPGNMDGAPSFVKSMINQDFLALQEKMMENKLPIAILTIVGAALCLYGAFEMRKRKKQGYIFWLVGELLPIATTIIFLSAAAYKGFGLFAVAIPIVFIILYTVNKKDLIY